MERRRVLSVGFLACLLTLSTLLAGTPAPSGTISVGDFAVLVAAKLDADSSRGTLSPALAVDVLRKHGLKVTSDLTSPLTEKETAQIFGQLGIVLQTEHPDSLLSWDRVSSLVGIFGSNMASFGDRQAASSFASKSSTGSAGTPTLDTTLQDCQSLPRPTDPAVIAACNSNNPPPQSVCNPCQDCCKNQLGLTGKSCGKACAQKNLVISPDEPTP